MKVQTIKENFKNHFGFIIVICILTFFLLYYVIMVSTLNNYSGFLEDLNTTSYTTIENTFHPNNPFDNLYITSDPTNPADATVRIVDADGSFIATEPIELEPGETVKLDKHETYQLNSSGSYKLEAVGKVEGEYGFTIKSQII